MAALAASPALAFGPPGWVVFGVAVVGTLVVGGELAWTVSKSQAVPDSRIQAKAKDCTTTDCPRPWSVRVHAQGTDIGGTSGSTTGAPAIVQTYPVAIAQGIALAGATYTLLTKSQKANLAPAYDKCIEFIQTCGGFLGQKSFYGRSRDNNRFDVDSYGISPNFVS